MMTQRITRLAIRTVFVALVILLGFSLAAPPAEAQGLQVFTVSKDDDQLRQIDPVTGATLGTPVAIMLSGQTVSQGLGLAVDPTDGTMYALLNITGAGGGTPTGPRELVTVNPTTGVATDIGPADDTSGIIMVDITFASDGTLYGVSSSAAGSNQDTLFTIDKTTGVPTAVTALTAGNFGHAIGFNPVDNLIYHSTGEGVQNTDALFETVDPAGPTITNVPLSVDDPATLLGNAEFTGLGFWGIAADGMFIASDRSGNLWAVTSDGRIRFLSTLVDHTATAVAVTGSAPDCTAAGQICGVAHIGNRANGPAVLYSISQTTGAASMVGPIGFERVSGMAFRADGTLFATGERMDGTDTDVLLTVDPSTGEGTEVGPTNLAALTNTNITDISFRRSDGVLFGVAEGNDEIITINTTTGATTLVGPHNECGFGNSLAFDFDDTLFQADGESGGNTCFLNTIDQSTGAATNVAALSFTAPLDTGDARVNAMDFDPTAGALFGSVPTIFGPGPGPRGSHLARINKATAVVTDVGATQDGLDAIAIAPVAADVAVTKVDDTGGTAVAVGDSVIYTVTVTNKGPAIAGGIVLTDALTFNGTVTHVSTTPSQGGPCNTAGFPTITCDLGSLANGASATVAIKVMTGAGSEGSIVNDASITSFNDPNATNDTFQVTTGVGSADVSVDKVENSADPIAHPGVIDYTITVTNIDSATQLAGGVVVTDTVSGAATTLASATPSQGAPCTGFPTIVCNLGDVATTATVNIMLNTAAPGTVTDTVNVTTATTDPDLTNNSDTETTLVQAIDLVVTKTDSGPTAINFSVTYTVTITNNGNVDANMVTLTDMVGGVAATFVSATPSVGTCMEAALTITCDLLNLAPGASATVTIVVTPTAAGTLTNTATAVAATPPEGVTTNNTASTMTTVAAMEDFSLSSTPASLTLLGGQTGTTTITVTPLPFVASVALSCSATIPLGGCSISPATVNPGNLPATATLTVTTTGFFNAAGLNKPLNQDAPLYAVWLPAAGFGVLGLVLVNEKRRKQQGGKARLVLIGLTLLLLLTLVVGCGPLGRDRSDEATPGGTYPVTVTGTGGGQTHSITVNVTVQP